VITIWAARIEFEDRETESAPLSDTMNLGDTVRLAGLPTPGFKPREDRRTFWWVALGVIAFVTLLAALKYVLALLG
jgi:hypothetical protein